MKNQFRFSFLMLMISGLAEGADLPVSSKVSYLQPVQCAYFQTAAGLKLVMGGSVKDHFRTVTFTPSRILGNNLHRDAYSVWTESLDPQANLQVKVKRFHTDSTIVFGPDDQLASGSIAPISERRLTMSPGSWFRETLLSYDGPNRSHVQEEAIYYPSGKENAAETVCIRIGRAIDAQKDLKSGELKNETTPISNDSR